MSVSAPIKLTLKDYKSELHNDWCPGCVRPDTRIVMGDGTSKAISEVKIVELVLGHDGQPHPVTEVMFHWHPGSMNRVRVKCFGELFLTSDHPMYVVRRQRRRRANTSFVPEWIEAGQVRVGDYPASPRVNPSMPLHPIP